VASVLSGLGFGKDDFTKLCSDFSGGWQMKIALARLLLSEPDMLLLDEPTNHLDAAAKAWLGGYVAGYDGTVVLVTHEESLLTRAALTGIVEVRDERALVFRGSYDKFLVRDERALVFRGSYNKFQIEREQRVLRAQTEWEQQQREIASLEDYITRFGAKASHAASAQSKQKMLDRTQQREIASLEDYITRFGAKASHAASAQSKQKMLDRIVRVSEPSRVRL
ncbi:P-loop containing nucleoside triphosphate hydrolase protein, partial [Baffinella frigidus]